MKIKTNHCDSFFTYPLFLKIHGISRVFCFLTLLVLKLGANESYSKAASQDLQIEDTGPKPFLMEWGKDIDMALNNALYLYGQSAHSSQLIGISVKRDSTEDQSLFISFASGKEKLSHFQWSLEEKSITLTQEDEEVSSEPLDHESFTLIETTLKDYLGPKKKEGQKEMNQLTAEYMSSLFQTALKRTRALLRSPNRGKFPSSLDHILIWATPKEQDSSHPHSPSVWVLFSLKKDQRERNLFYECHRPQGKEKNNCHGGLRPQEDEVYDYLEHHLLTQKEEDTSTQDD